MQKQDRRALAQHLNVPTQRRHLPDRSGRRVGLAIEQATEAGCVDEMAELPKRPVLPVSVPIHADAVQAAGLQAISGVAERTAEDKAVESA